MDSIRSCEDLLKSLKLSHLIDNFVGQEIDLETLKTLSDHDLKELVPQLGPRSKIKNYLKQCQIHVPQCTKSLSTATTVVIDNPECEIMIFEQGDLVSDERHQTFLHAKPHDSDLGMQMCDSNPVNQASSRTDGHHIKHETESSKVTHTQESRVEQNSSNPISENWLCDPDLEQWKCDSDPLIRASNSADQQSDPNQHQEQTHTKKRLGEPYSDSENVCAPPPQKKIKALRRFFQNDQSLEEFIISHAKTHTIYENYTNKKCLTSEERGILVASIIDGLLDRHDKVSKEVLIELSENIVEMFPTEAKSTYYHYNKDESRNARGKIHDRYHNERAARRRRLKQASAQGNEEGAASHQEVTAEIDSTQASKMNWLRYSSEPWPTVVEYWVDTHQIRIKETKEEAPLQTFISKWPTLQNPNGHALVSHIRSSYRERLWLLSS